MSTAVLRRILDTLPAADAPDGELLRRFVQQRDEPAFAELLRRHGPLVLGVCRRTLGDTHAAEDAFQAAFVQLARRAAGIRCDGSLAGWLHTVARRIALTARRAEQRRVRRESTARRPEASPPEEMTWRELRGILDAELAKLPEQLRLPLILCYLEDRLQAEAAARLGWPLPMLRGRLERGRQKLRQRLQRWGLPLAGPLVLLGNEAVSAELCSATLHAARAALAGEALSPAVAALAAAGPPALARWPLALACAACLALLGAGLAALTRPEARALPADPPAKPEAPAAAKLDALGDPLPDGAVMRLGTRRYRIGRSMPGYRSLPDGKTLLFRHATLVSDELRWVEVDTWKLLDSWTPPKPLYPVGLSDDGRFVLLANSVAFDSAVARLRGQIEKKEWVLALYDLSTRKPVWEKREQLTESEWRRVEHARFSLDNRWIISWAYDDREQRLWDAATGKELWHLPRGKDRHYPQCFADGANEVIFTNQEFADQTVYIRDRATGKPLRQFVPSAGSKFFSNDGAYLFVGGGKTATAVRVWETRTGKELAPLGGHEPGEATMVAVSGDGRTVVTGNSNGRVWDWPSGKFRRALNLGLSRVDGFKLSYDGKRLHVFSGLNSALVMYDVETGRRREMPGDGHGGSVGGLAVAPDGSLVSLGMDQVIRTWDLNSGKTIARVSPGSRNTANPFDDFLAVPPTSRVPKALVLSPDGRLLAATRMYGGDRIELIERATGKVTQSIPVDGQTTYHVAISPDGRLIGVVYGDPKKLTVFSLATREAQFSTSLDRYPNRAPLTFSPDSNTLAVGENRSVRFWDTRTWKEGRALEAEPKSIYTPIQHQTDLVYSRDGRMLATAGMEGIRVWETVTIKPRADLKSQGKPASGLAFSPSGRFLAWPTEQHTIHVWDGWTGEMLGPFTGHEGRVTDLAFAGERLASASEDTTILIWDIAAAAAKRTPASPADDAESAWRDLASDDAAAAFAAIRALAARPADAVRLARAGLKPAAPAGGKRVAALLKDLDSPRFPERQKAATGLLNAGEPAIPMIERFLAGQPGAEARRQAEQVLAKLKAPATDPECRRQIRAVEALERVATPEAKRLLEQLASGAPDATLTRHAGAALKRLK